MTATVTVIGAGITGLAAARHLADLTTGREVNIEVREASDSLGGRIRTSAFAGRSAVDEGPDAFLVRMPAAIQLARDVGLDQRIVAPSDARAAIWHHGLRPIPTGVLLGVPTSLTAIARSGLLSPLGMARAGLDLIRPSTSDDHDSIGRWVRSRFGNEVHDRLVDALVGSIYGADTDDFSIAAVPQLAALAARGRSALLSGRAIARSAPATTGPIFGAPAGGLSELVSAVADDLTVRHGDRVTITTSTPVHQIAPDQHQWRVDDDLVDAVIVAVPAEAAAGMIGGQAASGLGALNTCDVAMVTMAVSSDEWPDHARGRSGYLVPKSVQKRVTAVSFASQKWAHLADGHTELLRVSLGRDGLPVLHLDDDELIASATTEVSTHLGVDIAPTQCRVTRWPGAFTQYRPHHHQHVAHLDDVLPPGLTLAGASYRGIGIPACVSDGQRAAEITALHLEESLL